MLRKPYYMKDADLRDAVEKLNDLHSWINANIDAVLDVLRQAKFKDSGDLYKRDHEKMRAILDTTPFRVRAYIENMHYSRYLNADTMSTIKTDNCDIAHYMKVNVLVFSDGKVVDKVERLPHYEFETVKRDIEHSLRLWAIASLAEDDYRSTEYKLSHWVTT